MAGYWRGSGGQDEPGESDRAERLERQSERRPHFGDENTISDKELLSYFGYKSWDELARARSDEQLDPDEYEPPGQREEKSEPADQPADTDQPEQVDQPEQARLWRTLAEETGEVKSYPSYSAAKRDLGSVPETELHHVVEQAQAKPERSGFSVERINATDNIMRVPEEFHREISAHYSSKPLGYDRTVRDALSGQSWDDQYEYGRGIIDDLWRERRDDA